MATKQNISVPLQSDPKGVDIKIQILQEELINLPWLSFAYGQAFPIVKEVDGQRYTEPQVYVANREFLSVEPDDVSNAFSFFEITEAKTKIVAGSKTWRQPISLVIFANLELINILENVERDFIFTEYLIEQVTYLLSENRHSWIDEDSLMPVERGIEKAFSNYDYYTFDERYIKRNYDAFKISFDIIYTDDCLSDDIFLDPDYMAVVEKAVELGFSLPNTATQQKQSNLIIYLKDLGQWNNLETFGMFLDSNADFSRIDWVNPENIYTNVDSSTYSSLDGFTTDGATQYLDTNFIPSESSVNPLEMLGVMYENLSFLVSQSPIGCGTSDYLTKIKFYGVESVARIRVNCTKAGTLSDIDSLLYNFTGVDWDDWTDGIMAICRTDSTTMNVEFSKTTEIKQNTSSPITTTLNTNSITVGADKLNGTVDNFTNITTNAMWYGNGLEFSLIKSALEAYKA